MLIKKEMPKITEEQRKLLDEEIIDKEKFNMMNRKERREYLKEHRKEIKNKILKEDNMIQGYRPKGNRTSEGLEPPHASSSIMKEEKEQSKSFGAIIDEILNNPEIMMVQAGKIIKEAQEEAKKVINKNKKLEEALIEKDKEIAYLKGKVDTMQDIIKELNAPIEITQEK